MFLSFDSFYTKEDSNGVKIFPIISLKTFCGKINKSGCISILLDFKVFRRVFLYP